jgi:ribose transport system substrate-binding protein
MSRSIGRALVCGLAFLSAFTLGCSSTPAPKPPKAVKKVAFIANTSSDFWKIVRKGTEKADAEANDIEVIFKMPAGGTSKEQDRMMVEALNKEDVDAIAISPIDPAEQKKSINSAAKRVLVVTQDSDAPDSDRTLYLGADNRAAGRQAGELLKQALPKGGKVMVFVGKREVMNAAERFAGLKEAVAGSPIEIIDLMTDDNDLTRARDNVTETISKYPDVAGLVGLWSYNGPAILESVRNAKKTGQIKIVCFDDERATLNAIKEGTIFGTVAQQPFEYGYQAVHLITQILHGDRSVIPADKRKLIPTIVIQRNNVDEFRNRLNELTASK